MVFDRKLFFAFHCLALLLLSWKRRASFLIHHARVPEPVESLANFHRSQSWPAEWLVTQLTSLYHFSFRSVFEPSLFVGVLLIHWSSLSDFVRLRAFCTARHPDKAELLQRFQAERYKSDVTSVLFKRWPLWKGWYVAAMQRVSNVMPD